MYAEQTAKIVSTRYLGLRSVNSFTVGCVGEKMFTFNEPQVYPSHEITVHWSP